MTATEKKSIRYLDRLSPAVLPAFLLFFDLALADMPGDEYRDILWSAPDRGLVLYHGYEADSRKVCPQVTDVDRQPFCRTFEAEVLGACGFPEELQLVLANGEVYRVNSALLGAGGSFDAGHGR